MGKAIEGLTTESQSDIIKNMFSDKSIKTVNDFSGRLKKVFGENGLKFTGFNELVTELNKYNL